MRRAAPVSTSDARGAATPAYRHAGRRLPAAPTADAPLSDPAFPTLLAATALAALVVGFLKTSLGGGIGLVLTPTLSLVLPAPVVLALIAPLMILSDPITLRYYWRRWNSGELRLLGPPMLAGVLLGTWALTLLSEVSLKRAIGAGALVFAIIQLGASWRPRPVRAGAPPWSVGAIVGLVTGAASSLAHSGGIVLGLYFVARRLPPAAAVATSGALVALSNVLKLAGYWHIGFLGGPILLAAVLATPLLVLGAWLGYRTNRVLPRRAFELALLGIAIAGSVRLLLSA